MHLLSYKGWSDAQLRNLKRRLIKAGITPAVWMLNTASLVVCTGHCVDQVLELPPDIIEGHRKHVHSFLSTSMYEQAGCSAYCDSNHNCFRSLNVHVASHLNWLKRDEPLIFIDYDFALVPAFLSEAAVMRTAFFIRSHWPGNEYLGDEQNYCLLELANGILCAEEVCFYTQAACANFCNFVDKHMPDVNVSRKAGTATRNGKQIRLRVGLPTWQNAVCRLPNSTLSA